MLGDTDMPPVLLEGEGGRVPLILPAHVWETARGTRRADATTTLSSPALPQDSDLCLWQHIWAPPTEAARAGLLGWKVGTGGDRWVGPASGEAAEGPAAAAERPEGLQASVPGSLQCSGGQGTQPGVRAIITEGDSRARTAECRCLWRTLGGREGWQG